jgi:hypothetical protein
MLSAPSNTKKQRRRVATFLLSLFMIIPGLTSAEETTSETVDAPSAEGIVDNPPVTVTDTEKPKGKVARAIFTSTIVDREPVDNLTTVSTDTPRVFFFSDLRGLAGQIVTHRWEYNNEVMAEVTFKVGNGARWRVYSSKNLLPEWTGKWTVVVSDESGRPLKTSVFEYTDKAGAEAQTTSTP